jgi:3-oxoacyl-[acyl-carrier-protein] synthase-3
MSVTRSRILGIGSALPQNIVTNEELSKKVATTHDWIVQRTGIEQRHIAAENEKTSDLALKAATAALAKANVGVDEIDLIVLATTTPDEVFPSTATKVQAALGMTRGFAFDVQAVCSGFLYAMSVADQFIRSGQVKTALVIGAETMSRIVDWTDRGTCVLFGDGAGAAVLRADKGDGTTKDRGIIDSKLFSDGRHHDLLYVDGGPGSGKKDGVIKMQGREVFRHAVDEMSGVVETILTANNLTTADLAWLVPHQANRRIIEATGHKLNLPPEKVVVTVEKHGNTSAASIPLALASAQDKFKPGDLIVLEALGGGFTWGAVLLRW